MYLAIIILPLLASFSSGFFGRKIGVSGAQLISTSCIMITTLFATITFFEVGLNNTPVSLLMFKWIDSESLNVFLGFNFDSLTVSMLIPVLVVSSLVHLYSVGYMSHDPHNQRFFSYLSLFTFMMIILVTANNFLLMFVGWEGVGICSYLLVSFWFTRIAANQSSMSAFLTNRVGDCLLTIGMFTLLWSFGNIDYSTVFSLSAYMNENIITIIGVCLLIGAMAKSSQIGLHIWLPQAMEGPTPVSALIHAATMVTAGVYLLMRSSPLIEYSPTVLLLCLWTGAITTVFSSLIGLYQQDIKKVIAYSTMSQLGMMVIAVGLSSYNVALFHLVNHAFYKALLFLGAGAVIHAVADNQDFRKFGGLKQFLPLTYSVMLIASLSLVAFPFMTGFYSKDFILESAFGQFCFSSVAVYFIATIGAVFTSLYSVKVLYLTFLSNPAGPLTNYKRAHEGDIYMSLPLVILAFFSIFFGYFTKDIFIGLGSNFYLDNSIFIHPNHEIMIDTEFAVPILFKLLPLILTVILSILSLTISEFYYKAIISFKLSKLGYNIFSFLNQRFYLELFYNKYIVEVILKMGGQTTKTLDKGSIELLGPYGLEKGLLFLSNKISNLDTGVITNYALYILIGLIFYILIPSVGDYTLIIVLLFGLLLLLPNNSYKSDKYHLQSNLFSSLVFILLEDFFISVKNYIQNYIQTNIYNNSVNILSVYIDIFKTYGFNIFIHNIAPLTSVIIIYYKDSFAKLILVSCLLQLVTGDPFFFTFATHICLLVTLSKVCYLNYINQIMNINFEFIFNVLIICLFCYLFLYIVGDIIHLTFLFNNLMFDLILKMMGLVTTGFESGSKNSYNQQNPNPQPSGGAAGAGGGDSEESYEDSEPSDYTDGFAPNSDPESDSNSENLENTESDESLNGQQTNIEKGKKNLSRVYNDSPLGKINKLKRKEGYDKYNKSEHGKRKKYEWTLTEKGKESVKKSTSNYRKKNHDIVIAKSRKKRASRPEWEIGYDQRQASDRYNNVYKHSDSWKKTQSEGSKRRRANETAEQRAIRLQRSKDHNKNVLNNESPEQKEARLKIQREKYYEKQGKPVPDKKREYKKRKKDHDS